jgi:hypothetical protein
MKVMAFNGSPRKNKWNTISLQYSDYDQFESEMFDKSRKYKRHAEVFPEDCKRAFELGVRMATPGSIQP